MMMFLAVSSAVDTAYQAVYQNVRKYRASFIRPETDLSHRFECVYRSTLMHRCTNPTPPVAQARSLIADFDT
jgi:hypothetical protein